MPFYRAVSRRETPPQMGARYAHQPTLRVENHITYTPLNIAEYMGRERGGEPVRGRKTLTVPAETWARINRAKKIPEEPVHRVIERALDVLEIKEETGE